MAIRIDRRKSIELRAIARVAQATTVLAVLALAAPARADPWPDPDDLLEFSATLYPAQRLVDEPQEGFWLRPLSRARVELIAANDRLRPYSTAALGRGLTGAIALSCENAGGHSCGAGTGFALTMETQAGFADFLSGFAQVRAELGSGDYPARLLLDRGLVQGRLGPATLALGRDQLIFGPGSRTQAALGTNAAPLDHLRLGLAIPLHELVQFGLLYAVARLRDPQTLTGDLLSIQRIELRLFSLVDLGMTRLLQLGGKGGPPLDFATFIKEHWSRQPGPNGDGISNNRVGFDAALWLPMLFDSHIWYEFVFEDTRSEMGDAYRFDADHLVGIEARALPLGPLNRALLELQKTGRASHEHGQFATGMTNAGRTLGSPLGPDAWELFAQLSGSVGAIRLSPWFEWIQFDADRYDSFDPGPGGIVRTSVGPRERRLREGVDGRWRIDHNWAVEGRLWVEETRGESFVAGANYLTGGARVALELDLR